MDQEIDPLTRLPGRGALLHRLDDEIARAERYGLPLSLLLADVQGFGALSGARGPAAADDVLRRLALFLLSSAREEDWVARAGTEGFAILLPDTDAPSARRAADRLRAEAAAADLGDGGPLYVTLDVGLATFGPGLAESAALLAHAEEALRSAKRDDQAVRAFPEGDAPDSTA